MAVVGGKPHIVRLRLKIGREHRASRDTGSRDGSWRAGMLAELERVCRADGGHEMGEFGKLGRWRCACCWWEPDDPA